MGSQRKIKALIAALISWPAAAQTYDPTIITPQIIGVPQTMTALNLGDDATRSVNLGFTFDYFGRPYTSAWVSSNGFVSFQGPANLCCDGQPMEYAQRNTIYAYWTDLISWPNPYYKSIDGGMLFGWYGTNEYYNQNKNTFEIALYANGDIQINYGNVANSYHDVSAGLTGPTSTDNLSLFYGRNVTALNNQSWLLSMQKQVEVASPIMVTASLTPTAAPNPVATATATPVVQTQTQTQVQATPVETQVATTDAVSTTTISPQLTTETVATQTATVEVTSASTTTEQTTQETTQSTTTQTQTQTQVQQEAKEEQKEAMLPPGGIPGVPASFGSISTQSIKTTSETSQQASGEVKKDRTKDAANLELAADPDTSKRESVLVINTQDLGTLVQLDSQYTKQYGEQKTTDTQDVTYGFDPTDASTFGQVASSQTSAASSAIASATDTTSASSQNQQLTLLNMSNMQNEMSSGTPTDIGDVNQQDSEAMMQLTSIPVGYGAYTQARIPDMPFYKPRDIYQNKRIPDANVALYRMMRGQDQLWDRMTEDQYE